MLQMEQVRPKTIMERNEGGKQKQRKDSQKRNRWQHPNKNIRKCNYDGSFINNQIPIQEGYIIKYSR